MEPIPDGSWPRLRALLEEALCLPDDERTAFVRERCAAEPLLAERALSLLVRDAGHERWTRSPSAFASAPRELGAWVLEREIASGGMGSVHAAHRKQGGFEQRAAVKLVRQGMESEEAVRLFLKERQLLARLEHPGIARLLDGGLTADHRPYLVMEFVDGRPIDRFCAEEALDLRRRLELARKVCAAVSFLHRNLVVHRDLKPGNVLVTAEGEPKLVDFGIAKLLGAGADEAATVTERRILTPGYASPEQIRGLPVTTASDVYSLGVLFYELLTGVRPFHAEARSPSALERRVLEEDPPLPSAVCADRVLARKLRGDLDTILMMALRKEPERRYASAEELSEDLRRYLAGAAVHAHPESRAYLAARFVRRNPAAVLAGALFVLALVGGTATSSVLYLRQRDAREESDAKGRIAGERFAALRELTTDHLLDLHDRLYHMEGSTSARSALVETTQGYLERLAADEPGDRDLAFAIARAWRRTGLARGDPSWQSLGEYEEALESHERARAVLGELLAATPDDVDLRLENARNERNRANLLALLGRSGAALTAFDTAVADARTAVELAPERELEALEVLASAVRERATTWIARGRHAQGSAGLREARELELALASHQGFHRELPLEESLLLRMRQGGACATEGSHAEALEHYRAGLELYEAQQGATDAALRRRRTELLLLMARSLAGVGDRAGAASAVDEALAERRAAWGRDPKSLDAREKLAEALEARAALWFAEGANAEREAALRDLEEALALRERMAGEPPQSARWRRSLAEHRDELGEHLRRMGRAEEALALHLLAGETFEELSALDPENEQAVRDRSVNRYARARAHLELYEDEARPLAQRVAELARARQLVDEARALLVEQERRGVLLAGDERWIEGMERTLGDMDAELREQAAGAANDG